MSWLRLSQVAKMVGGTLHGEDVAIKSVSTDTRNIEKDQLFIAIKGERFDAHDFVEGITGKAAGALVHQLIDCDLPQVLVDDTHKALGVFASVWRDQLSLPVIALTGSNGKTTVKEMIASILSEQGNVLATHGNLNNDIGVPLTLLRLRDEHDYAVIEMGANHHGEIDYLTHIAKPDIALLNNAGAAHLEGFGSIKGVSRAKGEIFSGLRKLGIAVINADDKYANYWKGLCDGKRVVTFGMNNAADVSGEIDENGHLLINPDKNGLNVELKLLGNHNALNALAATAACVVMGALSNSVKQGLEKLQPVKGRLAPVKGLNGSELIDDTYNANPTSMQMGINVLSARKGTRILVLGDMGELGDDVAELHGNIGKAALEAEIDHLYCLGTYAEHASQAFGENAHHFSEIDDLFNALEPLVKEKTTILIKGSRAMKMERVINKFQAEEAS